MSPPPKHQPKKRTSNALAVQYSGMRARQTRRITTTSRLVDPPPVFSDETPQSGNDVPYFSSGSEEEFVDVGSSTADDSSSSKNYTEESEESCQVDLTLEDANTTHSASCRRPGSQVRTTLISRLPPGAYDVQPTAYRDLTMYRNDRCHLCDKECHPANGGSVCCCACYMTYCYRHFIEFRDQWLRCTCCQRYLCKLHEGKVPSNSKYNNLWRETYCDWHHGTVCTWCAVVCHHWIAEENRYCGERVCIRCSMMRLVNRMPSMNYGTAVCVCYKHMRPHEKAMFRALTSIFRVDMHLEAIGVTDR